ncbi:transporter [Luteimonas sp. TWI1416]|uniref:SphA family protein n=1 Tax=unclassified Luteimonas TaxID=2629088 RepID=UPI003207C8B1
MRVIAGIAVLALAGGSMCQAQADVTLPPVNLGDSTFQDGIAGPGWMAQLTLSAHRAQRSLDDRGQRTLDAAQFESVVLLGQLSVISNRRVLGAHWGGELIVPWVHAQSTPAHDSPVHTHGLGDVFISPLILQWPQTRLGGRPFWQRLNLNVTLPTGRYSTPGRLDAGRNVLQFNPHYAFTWERSDAWELSGRVHYLWTRANHDPAPDLDAADVQAGQAVHLNASISRSAGQDLRIGAALYALVQVTDDRIDGVPQPGRERIVGVGPALGWSRGAVSLHAAAYVETLAKDRSEGTRLSLRYAARF